MKAIENVKNALGAVDVVESMSEIAVYPTDCGNKPIDKQVKQIWRGFAYGKWRELRSEGLEGLVHKELK